MRMVFSCCLLSLLIGCTDNADRVFGTVERDRLTLTAPVGELISSIDVVEGQKVKMGDVLLRLDHRSANARVAQREAELVQAKSKLAEGITGARIEEIARAKATLQGANANLKEAQRSLERAEKLLTTHALSQADVDVALATRDTNIARQMEARENLRLLENGTRSEELDQARAAVMAAEANLVLEQKAQSDLTLIAAHNAVVDILPWRVGDRVAVGSQLIGLLATDTPYVRAYLPATWLDKVRVGSVVELYVDGRDTPITGKIRNIRSQPAYTPFYALNERDRARLMYLSDITISSNEGRALPTGMVLEIALPDRTIEANSPVITQSNNTNSERVEVQQ